MDELINRKQLDQRGWSRRQIRRAEQDGSLVRVRRGRWLEPREGDKRRDHRALLRAVLADSHPASAASHVSACVLWDLPLQGDLSQVWLTRPGKGGGVVRAGVHRIVGGLEDSEVTEVDGMRVTTVARTVVDMARVRDHVEAVMVADAALHRGLDVQDLAAALARVHGWPGGARARRVVEFADGLAESPYESWVRVLLDRMDLPRPLLQHEVLTPSEHFVARVDFAFPQWKLAIEYDGEGKYDELAEDGATPGAIFAREKRRDRNLMELGWHVLHLSKDDVHDWVRFQNVVRSAVSAAQAAAPAC